MAGRRLNRGNPVNRAHPLNRGLTAWWLAQPGVAGCYGSPTWRDIAGRNPGTLTNGPTWGARPGGGFGALNFDGTDDHVVTAAALGSTGDFSTASYFKPGASVVNFARLVTQKYDTAFWTGKAGSGIQYGGGIRQGGSPFGLFVNLPTSSDGWYLLLMSRAGSTQTVSIIADGGQNTATQACDTGALSGNTAYLGRETADTSYFTGAIGWGAIWDGRALDETHARQLWIETRRGFPGMLNTLPATRAFAAAGAADTGVWLWRA